MGIASLVFFLISMTVLVKANRKDKKSPLSSRIHSGSPTTYDECPFFATIFVDHLEHEKSKGGGCFLTNSWILTAAHLLDKLDEVWTTEKVFYVHTYHAKFWAEANAYRVAEFRRHPLYRKGLASLMLPDIGLIRLMQVDGKPTHISLPSPFEENKYVGTGKPTIFIGTGRPSSGPTDVRLLPVKLSKFLVTGDAYWVEAVSHPDYRPDYGDSGGPVFAATAGRNVVIAVENSVAWVGDKIAVRIGSTRVTRVISWILHSMDSSPAGAPELEASMNEWMSVIVGDRHLVPRPQLN